MEKGKDDRSVRKLDKCRGHDGEGIRDAAV